MRYIYREREREKKFESRGRELCRYPDITEFYLPRGTWQMANAKHDGSCG